MLKDESARILLLTDYRDAFSSNISTKDGNISMDIAAIHGHFSEAGLEVTIKQFADVDLSKDYTGNWVLYTSSEDSLLLYKSYIEDVMLAMQLRGACLLPRYEFLRAHHNKSMMEALRWSLFGQEALMLNTRIFGAWEELRARDVGGEWPKVVKGASGAGSTQVVLANDRASLLQVAKEISKAPDSISEVVREHAKRILRRWWHPRSLHRNKFVVQEMIKELSGDFKVLCLGEKFYVLYRANRPSDFRASGSGLFTYDFSDKVNEGELLDYALSIYRRLGTPIASLDVGFDGNRFHLIEFQALHFGTLTAERSSFYYRQSGNGWERVSEACEIERVFCDAIVHYIANSAHSIYSVEHLDDHSR